MLIAALLLGALTAYYFGLRPGLYAAAATAALCMLAMFKPGWSLPIYGALAISAVAVIVIGPRRKRPPDVVLAVRWARQRLRSLIGQSRETRR
jgi:hypothetical protein